MIFIWAVILLITSSSQAQNLNTSLVNKAMTEGSAESVFVMDDRLYAGFGTMFQVFDISSPAEIHLLGAEDLGIGIYNIYVTGEYAFVCLMNSKLAILDISDPFEPQEVSRYEFSSILVNTVRDVIVIGQYAYVSADQNGLWILDISDPTHPDSAGYYPVVHAYDAEQMGEILVALSNENEILNLDISVPTQPWEINSFTVPGNPYEIAVRDSLVYVAGNNSGFRIYDNSSLAEFPLLAHVNRGVVLNIDIEDDIVCFVSENSGVYLYDVSNPAEPIQLDHYPSRIYWPRWVDIDGSYAYLAERPRGITVIDISEPTDIDTIAHGGSGNYPLQAVYRDGLVYVANYQRGLDILDMTNPFAPTHIANLETHDIANQLAIRGDLLYLADTDSGFMIIDISTPSIPFERANLVFSDRVFDVFVEGDYAYLSVWHAGVQIVDISNPDNPEAVGAYDPAQADDRVFDVAVVDSTAYVAYEELGLHIVDVSNPVSPVLLGSIDFGQPVKGVDILDTLALLACDSLGLVIVDITDPMNPEFVSSRNRGGVSSDNVVAYGHNAFLISGEWGIHVYDCSEPQNPVLSGWFDSDGSAKNLHIDGDYGYLADRWGGMAVLDLSPFSIESASCLILTGQGDRQHNSSTFFKKYNPAANHAFTTLARFRAYLYGRVFYMNSNPWQDMNGDELDDNIVDHGQPTVVSIRNVLLNLRNEIDPGFPNVIFITGDAAPDSLFLSTVDSQPILADSLGSWLNIAGLETGTPLIIVIDAAYSGSFLEELTAENRVIITSTDTDQSLFENPNLLFSDRFWDNIANGDTLWDAFQAASHFTDSASGGLQTPLIDADGDGIPNEPEDEAIARGIQLGRDLSTASLPIIIDTPSSIDPDSGFIVECDGAMDAVWYHVISENYEGSPPIYELPGNYMNCIGGNRYLTSPIESSTLDPDEDYYVLVDALDQWVRPAKTRVIPVIRSQSAESPPANPLSFQLYQNYPNPFNSATTIKFEIPFDTRVSIDILNILGQRVVSLTDKTSRAGIYHLPWNARTTTGTVVSSGVYFVRMKTNEYMKVNKMLLLR